MFFNAKILPFTAVYPQRVPCFRLVQVTTGYYKHTYQADKWLQIKQYNTSYCSTIYLGCSFEEYLVAQANEEQRCYTPPPTYIVEWVSEMRYTNYIHMIFNGPFSCSTPLNSANNFFTICCFLLLRYREHMKWKINILWFISSYSS